jgi:hypothetical protein
LAEAGLSIGVVPAECTGHGCSAWVAPIHAIGVAILLCRENPAAVRVRPSRGDGGIDILVPLYGTGTVAVYQVKLFTANLTRGQ